MAHAPRSEGGRGGSPSSPNLFPLPYDDGATPCQAVQATNICANDTYGFSPYCLVLFRVAFVPLGPVLLPAWAVARLLGGQPTQEIA